MSPTADEVQRRAVSALRDEGIATLRFDELFDDGLWGEALRDIEPFVRESEETARRAGDRPAGKEEVILRRFFDKAAEKQGAKPTLSVSSPWLRIAASDALLGIVNAYRQVETMLFYVDNWFTVPYPSAGERVASQRWHRDPEDEHVVKLFVYLSDVDDGAGPFEYVRGSATGGRYGHLWPWQRQGLTAVSDELEDAVAAEDVLTMRGPAGTIVLCDTGGFHRGGFARTTPRILSVATYLQPGLKGKWGRRRFDVDFEGREDALPEPVRTALA
jgi:hypothetical protein